VRSGSLGDDSGAMTLMDLIFPGDCVGCGATGALGCRRCVATLSGPASLAWPQPAPPGLPPPYAVAAYSGPCRDLLLAYKERGASGLRGVLAVPLAAALRAGAAAVPDRRRLIVVPVPSAGRAIRERGDDVVLGLTRRAAAIARREGRPLWVVPALSHSRLVADSAGLGATARATNLAGAFALRPRARRAVAGASVLIADDLITTGVTLAEAARAVREGGAHVVAAATVAATARLGEAGLLGAKSKGTTVGRRG
jgi:predicted amidophosphoribosyltransferase